MALGIIHGNTVVVAQYGARVEILGRVLYNPTEETYRRMGFRTLPTTNPPEGWHDEWYVENYRIKVRMVQDEPDPEPELRRQFTKGELLEALVACGLYEQAKAIYVNDVDLQIAWAGFADIDMDYQAAKDIMQQYSALFTPENVEKLLRFITTGEVPNEPVP